MTNENEKILMTYGGRPLDDLPADLRERIEANPELKAEFLSQYHTARLVSLKRCEVPDPALEGRLIHRVGTQLRARIARRERWNPGSVVFPEWARMVAVVLVMLGLSVLTHREMLHSDDTGYHDDPVTVMDTDPAPEFGGEIPGIPRTVDASRLHHEDAFTTRFSGFQFTLDELNLPTWIDEEEGRDLESALATGTNEWSSPLVMPVRFDSP